MLKGNRLADGLPKISIMFPWVPTPAKLKRMWSGGQLYMILKNVVDERKKEDRRENDALQYLIDQGDSVTDMITVSHPMWIKDAHSDLL